MTDSRLRGSVLRRNRRYADQPAVPGLLGQKIEKKLAGFLHHRIDLRQIGRIAAEKVTVPQMLAEPSVRRGPHAAERRIDHAADTPDVRIVVGRPSTRPVHLRGRLPARNAQVADHVDQRSVQFGQVRRLGRPVVHFRIDVDRVLAVPCRKSLMIPNALQIGWLTAGLRRTDQQIATELKIERRELRIKTGGELAHPHVGRLIGLSVRSQIERYPFDPRTVSRDVVGFQPGIALFPRTRQIGLGPFDRIAGNVPVVVEIGCDRDQNRDGIGIRYRNSDAVGHRFPSLRQDLRHRAVPYHPGNRLVSVGPAVDQQTIVARGGYPIIIHRRSERSPKRNPPPLGSGQADYGHLIGEGGEHLPLVTHAVHDIAHGRYGRLQIQIPIELRASLMSRKIEQQRPGRLVRHPVRRVQRKLFVAQLESLVVLSPENQPPDLGQRGQSLRTDIVMGTAGPNGLLVKLKLLAAATAVHHDAQTAVAQRKRLLPAGSRLVVPKLQRPGSRSGRKHARKKERNGKQKKKSHGRNDQLFHKHFIEARPATDAC